MAKGDPLYNVGDTEINFYLILEGKASHLLPKSEQVMEEEYYILNGFKMPKNEKIGSN